MRLRKAVLEEADTVASVWLRSRWAAAPAIPPPAHTEAEVRGWFRRVVLPSRDVWVADDNGELVALLVLDDGWIDQLYVDPGHTSRGIGRELMAVAKEQRPAGLKLWTFQSNVRARRFYEAHGFVMTGSTDGDNEEGVPDVRYEWSPSGAS